MAEVLIIVWCFVNAAHMNVRRSRLFFSHWAHRSSFTIILDGGSSRRFLKNANVSISSSFSFTFLLLSLFAVTLSAATATADVVIISFQNIVFSYRIGMIAWRYVADVHAVAVVIFGLWRGPGVGYCVGFIVSVHNLKMCNIVTWALSLTSILEFMFSIAYGRGWGRL